MNAVLSQEQLEQVNQLGYVSPISVLSEDEASGYRAQLEAAEAACGGALKGHQRNKSHLLFKWLDDLIRDLGFSTRSSRSSARTSYVGTRSFGSNLPSRRLLCPGIKTRGIGDCRVIRSLPRGSRFPCIRGKWLYACIAEYPPRRRDAACGPLSRRQHADARTGNF